MAYDTGARASCMAFLYVGMIEAVCVCACVCLVLMAVLKLLAYREGPAVLVVTDASILWNGFPHFQTFHVPLFPGLYPPVVSSL